MIHSSYHKYVMCRNKNYIDTNTSNTNDNSVNLLIASALTQIKKIDLLEKALLFYKLNR